MLEEIATLIDVDNATLMWENLEFARLKVRLQNDRFIKVGRRMRINDQTLSVSLEEESPGAIAGYCKGTHCYHDSLDSISSTDTYVEESAFSVKKRRGRVQPQG